MLGHATGPVYRADWRTGRDGRGKKEIAVESEASKRLLFVLPCFHFAKMVLAGASVPSPAFFGVPGSPSMSVPLYNITFNSFQF
jgi:hypothetical protein